MQIDSIFGIGWAELVVILLLAGLVMGPHRLREVARWLGKMTAQLQAISRGFARQLNAELDAIEGGEDIRGTLEDVQELRRQVEELKQELKTTASEPARTMRTAVKEGRNAVQQPGKVPPPPVLPPSEEEGEAPEPENSIAPPRLPTPIDVPDDPE